MDASTSKDNQSCVQVAVRLRPLNDEEASQVSVTTRPRFGRPIKTAHDRAWTCSSTTIQQTGVRCVEGKSAFSFDHMFGEDSTTEAIYDEMVRPIVWGITNGKHGTVFCYGQTGSGKTFTMQGTIWTSMKRMASCSWRLKTSFNGYESPTGSRWFNFLF
ncbi:hypothetical protein MHU86_850 [Fragilaria crotonensis]|nr:hypothetical protein MHU86_850 [Fragilaria crotonensis]